jgi:hypothetical protein
MTMTIVKVDLTEAGCWAWCLFRPEQPLRSAFEHQFRAGQQTDRGVWITFRRKTSRKALGKLRGYQPIAF